MKEPNMNNALTRLIEGIEKQEGLQVLFEYTPRTFKLKHLLSLDLDKIKKDFGNSVVGLIDFVEILFTQLFNLSNPLSFKNIFIFFFCTFLKHIENCHTYTH